MSIFCSLCGEELTAPKFHNGKPYGYSCFAKITGKKSRDKRQFVSASIAGDIPSTGSFPLTLEYNGKRYRIGCVLRDANGKLHSQLAEFGSDGSVYMVTHDRAGKPIWKNIN